MSPSAIKSNGHKGIPPLERQRVVSPNDPGLMARVWHQKWHLFGTRTRLPRCTFSARASGEEKAGRSSEGSREHPAARTFDGLVEQVWGLIRESLEKCERVRASGASLESRQRVGRP